MWNMGHLWAQVRSPGVVLVLAMGTGLLVGSGTPATPGAHDIRLFQFNMCGHSCSADDAEKVRGVVGSLAAFHPDAVSLNELCRPQLAGIRHGVDGRGWPMNSRFMVTKRDGCGAGVDYGIAVLTRSIITDAERLTYAAQNKGSTEFRGLLCVQVDLGHRQTHICTTHIVAADEDPQGDIRRAQIRSAASLVRSYDVPVVLMGDFNLPPTDSALSALYTRSHLGGGFGDFDEIDQGPDRCRCGEATHSSGAKFDYIFVSARDFDVADGDTTSSSFSDHSALRGWIVRLPDH